MQSDRLQNQQGPKARDIENTMMEANLEGGQFARASTLLTKIDLIYQQVALRWICEMRAVNKMFTSVRIIHAQSYERRRIHSVIHAFIHSNLHSLVSRDINSGPHIHHV